MDKVAEDYAAVVLDLPGANLGKDYLNDVLGAGCVAERRNEHSGFQIDLLISLVEGEVQSIGDGFPVVLIWTRRSGLACLGSYCGLGFVRLRRAEVRHGVRRYRAGFDL